MIRKKKIKNNHTGTFSVQSEPFAMKNHTQKGVFRNLEALELFLYQNMPISNQLELFIRFTIEQFLILNNNIYFAKYKIA